MKEDIIRMAREAGFMQHLGVIAIPNIQNLERFAALVTAEKDEKIQELENMILELQERNT